MQFFTKNEKINIMTLKQEDSNEHNHDFLELVYVTKGKAIHILNKEKAFVKAGDYFIIDYGAFHKYNTIENENFEIVNILVKPEFIDKMLFLCRSFQDLLNNYLIRFSYTTLERSPTNSIFCDDDRSILTLIENLKKEYAGKDPGYLELMRCYLIEILINTMRKINKKDKGVVNNDYSKYIVDFIEENYMKKISLTELSKELNFSLPYLSKRFRNDAGITFNSYLQKKRVENGCRLIANTDKKFSEIAKLVGYSDMKFFNKIFKKHLGMTPMEFKKLKKQ